MNLRGLKQLLDGEAGLVVVLLGLFVGMPGMFAVMAWAAAYSEADSKSIAQCGHTCTEAGRVMLKWNAREGCV